MHKPEDCLNICGPNVRRLRMSQKPLLTQEQLSTKLQILGWDIDRFGISKIERGRRHVTDKELLLLAEALDASFSELLRVE